MEKKNNVRRWSKATVDDIPDIYPYNVAVEAMSEQMSPEDARKNVYLVYAPGLLKCIEDLPGNKAGIVRMRFEERLAYREIAEKTGRTHQAVHTLIRRILEMLYSRRERWMLCSGQEIADAKEKVRIMSDRVARIKADAEKQAGILQRRNSGTVPVSDRWLSKRARVRLEKLGVRNMQQLQKYTRQELMSVRGIGEGTVNEIESSLNDLGLKLKEE